MVKRKYKLENDLKLLNWNDVTNQKLEWLDKSNYLWHLEKEGLITTVDLENATKEYLNKLNLKIRNPNTSFMITCYLLNSGYDYEPSKNYVINECKKVKNIKIKNTVVVSKNKNKELELLNIIMDLEDNILTEKKLPNFQSILSDINAKEANYIINYYKPIYEEYIEAQTNSEIAEGYSRYTNKDFKKICGWYEKLFEVCNSYTKTITKTRKTKPKTPLQLIKGLKYCKKDEELKSVDPKTIIGSKCLVTYNVKNRKIFVYVSDKEISVKGTSIINYNPEKSFCKVLRKRDMISDLISSTRLYFQKEFEKLTTKANAVTGRIDANTILCKVYKK